VQVHADSPPPSQRPLAVVVSRYTPSVTDALLAGAIEAIGEQGLAAPAVIDAPGTFELPALAARCARSGAYAGVVCLGCVIRGETRHDRYIASAVAHALAELSVQTGLPIGFGVITAETGKQARERAGGAKGHKGREAAAAVIHAVRSIARLEAALAAGTPTLVEPAPALQVPAPQAPDKAAH
jgi:6,7-dimethyl-8-ribityllumazine synthase